MFMEGKNTNPECWIVQLTVGLYILSNLDYWTKYWTTVDFPLCFLPKKGNGEKMTLTKIFNKHLLKSCGTNNILQKALILDPKKADEISSPEHLLGDRRIKSQVGDSQRIIPY